jgi:hypothetical protein
MPDKKSIRPILPKRRLPLNSVGGNAVAAHACAHYAALNTFFDNSK